jgi:hypothetical protein
MVAYANLLETKRICCCCCCIKKCRLGLKVFFFCAGLSWTRSSANVTSAGRIHRVRRLRVAKAEDYFWLVESLSSVSRCHSVSAPSGLLVQFVRPCLDPLSFYKIWFLAIA